MSNRESGHLFHYTVYHKNTALKLIFGLAILFVLFQILSIVFMIFAVDATTSMSTMMIPNAAILDWNYWKVKPWTIITYGLLQTSFWHLLPNALWLYLFGNIFQSYHRGGELPYLFFIPTIIAGFIYLFIIKLSGIGGQFIMSTTPGVVSIATATMLLHPNYKLLVGGLKIPLWVLLIILLGLSAVGLDWRSINVWILLSASALLGLGYGMLVKRGIYVSEYIDRMSDKVNKYFSPQDRPTNKYGWSTDKLMNEAIRKNPSQAAAISAIAQKLEREGLSSLSVSERLLLFGIE